jgi:hypothetical protein
MLERIARVLAGQRISANAEGIFESASDEVDERWPDFADDALAVLRTLREPDLEMASVGDPRLWEAMVRVAINSAENGGRPLN